MNVLSIPFSLNLEDGLFKDHVMFPVFFSLPLCLVSFSLSFFRSLSLSETLIFDRCPSKSVVFISMNRLSYLWGPQDFLLIIVGRDIFGKFELGETSIVLSVVDSKTENERIDSEETEWKTDSQLTTQKVQDDATKKFRKDQW